jgi:hypothetical protein
VSRLHACSTLRGRMTTPHASTTAFWPAAGRLASFAVVPFLMAVPLVADRGIAVALGCVAAVAAIASCSDIVSSTVPGRAVAAGAAVVVSMAIAGSNTGVVAAAAVAGVPILLVHLLDPGLIGFGDVELASLLGGALGLVTPLLAAALLPTATITAFVIAIVARRRRVAFAPHLLVAFELTALVGIVTLGYDA